MCYGGAVALAVRDVVGSCSSVVEHSLGKGEVDSSILSTSSNLKIPSDAGVMVASQGERAPFGWQ